MELTGYFKVVGVKKKTKAKFFKDLQIGDEFSLSYNLNGSYKSAPLINIYKDGRHQHSKNALELSRILDNFIIVEI
jgi:hypothetical protein